MRSAWLQTFAAALKLGLLSFGGPTAHIGYFREEYVVRRRWLDDAGFADLVALCQLLPGPASSQAGIGIGWMRAGWPGAVAAWVGFTLPSALAMAAFAYLYGSIPAAADSGWVRGLECAAVVIVAHALLGLGRALAPDKPRATIAAVAAAAALLVPHTLAQIAVIAAAAAAGWWICRRQETGRERTAAADTPAVPETTPATQQIPGAVGNAGAGAGAPTGSDRRIAVFCLTAFFVLLLGLPLLSRLVPWPALSLFESFYRSGALVFGGGHVVLPLLEQEVVPSGWVSEEAFIAGYAATQAMPGPLFTFAAFLGAAAAGWTGALLAVTAVFLPGFLLVLGVLPFWQQLKQAAGVKSVVYGINAAVAGILLAALYDPLFTGAVRSATDFAVVAVLFVLFTRWRFPPWALVLLAAAAGAAIYG